MTEDNQNIDEVKCPYCAENIKAKAKKCKHCGEILDSQLRELSFLRKQQASRLIVNNNIGTERGFYTKIEYPFGFHLFLSVITCGTWIPIWFLLWLMRDRNVYL